MALIAKKGGDFEAIPEGSYQAVCYGVIGLGKQLNTKFNTVQEKVQILWELPEEVREFNGEESCATIFKDYTVSLSDRATLRQDLESWRGKGFTAAELEKGVDLLSILGKNCLIQIIHNDKGYANVASVMSLPKGMQPMESTREQILFDFDEAQSLDVMDTLPEFLQKKIQDAVNFEEVFGVAPAKTTPKRDVQRDAAPRQQTAAASTGRTVGRTPAPAQSRRTATRTVAEAEPRTDVF
jgi:hypothetical protein